MSRVPVVPGDIEEDLDEFIDWLNMSLGITIVPLTAGGVSAQEEFDAPWEPFETHLDALVTFFKRQQPI
jgi:hypothetical protein